MGGSRCGFDAFPLLKLAEQIFDFLPRLIYKVDRVEANYNSDRKSGIFGV